MKNKIVLKYIKVVVIISFLLLGIASMTAPNTTSAALSDVWWDDDWSYRKGLSITSTDESTYIIDITVHRSSGTDSGGNVYVGTDCESDYDDIRFTTNGSSPSVLDYWIESSDSSSADIWVEFTGLDSTSYFYMYYGYSSASAVSNGDNTFLFFDDFNDGSLNTYKWTKCYEWGYWTYTEEDGYGKLEDTDDRCALYSDTNFDDEVAMYARVKFDDFRGLGFIELDTANGNKPNFSGDLACIATEPSERSDIEDEGTGDTTAISFTEDTWQVVTIAWDSGSHVRISVDGSIKETDYSNLPDGTPGIPIYLYTYDGDADPELWVDYIFVKHYDFTNGVTFGSWGYREWEGFSDFWLSDDTGFCYKTENVDWSDSNPESYLYTDDGNIRTCSEDGSSLALVYSDLDYIGRYHFTNYTAHAKFRLTTLSDVTAVFLYTKNGEYYDLLDNITNPVENVWYTLNGTSDVYDYDEDDIHAMICPYGENWVMEIDLLNIYMRD